MIIDRPKSLTEQIPPCRNVGEYILILYLIKHTPFSSPLCKCQPLSLWWHICYILGNSCRAWTLNNPGGENILTPMNGKPFGPGGSRDFCLGARNWWRRIALMAARATSSLVRDIGEDIVLPESELSETRQFCSRVIHIHTPADSCTHPSWSIHTHPADPYTHLDSRHTPRWSILWLMEIILWSDLYSAYFAGSDDFWPGQK